MLGLALALGGGGGCGGNAFVRRDLARRTWRELATPHFVLTTDLGERAARARAADLEQKWWALADHYALIAPGVRPPEQAIHIVLFADCRDYRAVATAPETTGFATDTRDFERHPILVTCEDAPWRQALLLHELVHGFNGVMLGNLPVWLNEGLAEYYSALEVEDGKVVLGRMPPLAYRFWDAVWRMDSYGDLLERTSLDFYGRDGARRYLAAWKLVHLLNNSSDEYHARFLAYLSALAGGSTREAAWQRGFGSLPAGRLAKDFAAYDVTGEVRLWTAPYELRRPDAPVVRELGRGEVHGLWIGLQLVRMADFDRNDRDPAPLLAHLEYAAADDPAWPGVLFWRGVVAARLPGRTALGDPVALLRRYVERVPGDARGWLALVVVQLDRLGDLDAALAPEPPAGLEAIEPDVRALVRVGATPAELEAVARYYALRHKPEVAFSFAERALAVAPGCAPCLETMAAVALQRDRPGDAVALQSRAIDVMSDAEVPPGMARRLVRYREAALRTAPR